MPLDPETQLCTCLERFRVPPGAMLFCVRLKPAYHGREHDGGTELTTTPNAPVSGLESVCGRRAAARGVSRLEFRSSNRRRLLVGKLVDWGGPKSQNRLAPSPRSNLFCPSSEASNWEPMQNERAPEALVPSRT
jgi:hypothetical protein